MQKERKMRLRDMKVGMRVKAVDDYCDCIHKGKIYEIKRGKEGRFIECDEGNHLLKPSAYQGKYWPELEPTS